MKREVAVLALGSQDSRVFEFAKRASQMGFRVVSAKTPADAIALRAERGFQFGAALFDAELPMTEKQDALATLRTRLMAPELSFIAAGDVPAASTRAHLRSAGVELALWQPCSDHTLRFQINRALARVHPNFERTETRVPVDWRARIFTSGRQKPAAVYSISGGGAYLATHQPSMSGAELAVELPLPSGPATLHARVLYTNVPGNLRSENLPDGMAVAWGNVPDQQLEAIRAVVTDSAASLQI